MGEGQPGEREPKGEGWSIEKGLGTESAHLKFGLGLYVVAVEPGPNRRIDEQLRGRSGRQGDEGATRLYASLDDETFRFYGTGHVRARALRALRTRPFLERRAARRVIDDAQRRAERIHYGQRRALFEFDLVIEAQRAAMLAARERVLQHPAPDEAVWAFIPEVAAGELARRPAGSVEEARWWAGLVERYGLPSPPPEPPSADALAALLAQRFERAREESGARWPALARSALLRIASELWARHVEAIDHLRSQAPVLFASLPAPAVISFATEAGRRYDEYLRAVRAETMALLLTLPQPYERPLPPAEATPPSDALAGLLHAIAANEAPSVHNGS